MINKFLIRPILIIFVLLLSIQITSNTAISPAVQAQQSNVLITDPQYIFVRKAPNQSKTYPFNTSAIGGVTKGGFEEIINAVGTRGTADRKLGVAIFFDILNAPPETLKDSLQKSLQYSKETKLPLLIKLDTFNWWGNRPDLWNWFDPNLPGFNVANKENVEWTSYDDSTATKIAWRNWGRQLRVHPHPNLGSPRYRQAQKEALEKLLPEIKNFKDSLTPEEQYLFGGVVIGVEIAVGSNFFYYKDGNLAYETCPSYADSGDPRGPCSKLPTTDPKFFIDQTTNVNYNDPTFPKLGYNAAKTLGIRTSGELTASDNDRIVQNYVTYINSIVLASGIPVNKIYSHTSGSFDGALPGYQGSYSSSKVAGLIPGWSFYGQAADLPEGYSATHPVLSNFMNDANNATYPWAAPEWLPSPKYNDRAGWVTSMKSSLNYKNNKLIGVANWESIFGCMERNPDGSCKANVTNRDFNGGNNAIQAIADVLNEPTTSYCTVSPSYLLSTTKENNNTVFQASINKPGTTTYIQASTAGALSTFSQLQNPNLINSSLDNTNPKFTYTGTHNGTAYLQFITDGCNGKRIVSEVFTVQLGASQTVCPKKSQGDANCDNNISIADFELWRQEYQQIASTKKADFDNSGIVNLKDFEDWRKVFSAQ